MSYDFLGKEALGEQHKRGRELGGSGESQSPGALVGFWDLSVANVRNLAYL